MRKMRILEVTKKERGKKNEERKERRKKRTFIKIEEDPL